MAVSAGGAVLQVTPQLVKTFSRDLATQLAGPSVRGSEKAGREHGRRFGNSFSGGIRTGVGPVKGILRGFGPGLAAAFGGAALVGAIKSVTDEAREAAVVGKQTQAVLKSTGGVANVSAKGVANLAESISNAVGVDDELIQSGENWLLTFKNVRDEAGKGNDVFTRASKSAVDLAASMHQGEVSASGLHSANTLLGKALNDPLKGMTALSRAGVTFNAQQQEQIKTLVKSGDTLGAQKLILAEVESQTKGFAAASADSGKRFGVFVANLKEQIGTVLLPIMNRLLGFLIDNLPKAFTTIGHATQTVVGWFRRAGDVLRSVLGPALASIGESVAPAAEAFTESLLPGLKSLWHVVQAQVLPALKVLAAIIGVALYAALKYVLPLLLRIAGPVLGFFFKQLAQTIQWISDVIRFIGRLGAWLLRWIAGTKTTGQAIQELGRRVGVFAANMTKQWQGIVRTVGGALGFLRRTTVTVLSFMIRMWLRWAGSIVDAAATALGWLPGVGPKIRAAAAKFHEFANSVNASLNRIRDKHVDVTARSHVEIAASVRSYLKAAQVPGFHATGGPIRGPGTGTSDSIPAMLSAGEHVWTAKEVKGAGGHGAVEALRAQVARGYARGGPVLDVPVHATGNPADILSRFYHPTIDATRRLGQKLSDRLAALIGKGLSKAINEGIGGGKASVKAFIKSVDPLPYIWAAAGPGGYDCSGLVSAVYGLHTGRGGGHGQRYFTTSSIGAAAGGLGLRGGPGGVLQIGVRPGQHMAGRYGGLGFEAESTATGIKIGSAASPPGSFPVQYHLAKGGAVAKQLASLGIEVGGDSDNMWLRQNKRIGIFDRGGTLTPGLNLVANTTGRDEPLVPAGGGPAKLEVHIHGAVIGSDLRTATREMASGMRAAIRDAQRHSGVPKREQVR